MAKDVVSPMAGAVREILIAVGQTVSNGQEVVILESMKMEIPVECTADGTVAEILVGPGSAVEEGQALFRVG